MAKGEDDSILRFSCDSCGTHLGVDESLAGTEAPCPKCGALLKAPVSLNARIPDGGAGSAVTRGISGGMEFRSEAVSSEPFATQSHGEGRRRERGNRSVYPSGGGMSSREEKENLKVLVKILIAVALVGVLVGLVVWYLENY